MATPSLPEPKKSRSTKLDSVKEQVLLWSANMTTRQIQAKLAEAPYSLKVSQRTVVYALNKWRGKELAQVAQRADKILIVTREIIEAGWGKQLAECEANYYAAKQRQDEPAMAVWMAAWQKVVERGVGRFFPPPATAPPPEPTGQIPVDEFWKRVKEGK